jgi:undecaprenyl-diphosphatase
MIEAHLREAPMIVAGLLICFGIILWLAEWRGRKQRALEETGWFGGFIIGVAQALALAPGVSRSGITITAGLAFGMTREAAARYSFLLSLPIIGGAALYGLNSVLGELSHLPGGALNMFAVGFLSAGVSGYLCVRYFLRYLQRRALAPFVIYRVVLGLGVLGWFAMGRA